MTNRAGTLVSNLSGEMAYESFRSTLLPPNPPIEVSGELFTKLMHSSQEAPDRSRSHLQHTQESCQRLRPSGVFFKTFSNSSTVIPASFAASSIVTRPFLTSLTNIRMKDEKRLNGGGFRFWRCCRSTRAFVRIFLQETRTNIANEVVYHGERLRLFWQRQYRICPL